MEQIQGNLAVGPQAAVLQDLNSPAGSNGWTAGARSIAPLTAQPTIARPWTIYGWGIQAYGYIVNNTQGARFWGRFGKLLASIMFGGTFTPLNNVAFAQPDPAAIPNLQTLWDGDKDTALPSLNVSGNSLPTTGFLNGQYALPAPQPLKQADQIAIGIWLTPSLINNLEITFFNISYSLIYDVERGRR